MDSKQRRKYPWTCSISPLAYHYPPKHSKTRTGRVLGDMELTGVEPVSKLGINTPLIHRFSFSSPRSGNPTLCPVGRTPRFGLKLVSNPINETKSIRWGYSSIVNGVESEALEPELKGYFRQQLVQLYERRF